MNYDHAISRRGFLTAAGALAAGAALGAPAGRQGKGGAARPLVVAVRDVNLRDVGEKDIWAALAAVGAQGVEVDVNAQLACPALFGVEPAYSIADEASAKRLAEDAQKNNIRITAFCMHNQFDTRLDEEVKSVAAVAKICRATRTRVIRLDVVPRKIKDANEFLKFAIDICKQSVAATEDAGVRLGIENHGNTTNNPQFLEKLFDGVGSDRLGLTLDTGNFYWFGHPLDDLYGIYRRFAPRAFHTHCKSIKYPEDQRNTKRPMGWEYAKFNCPITEGDIDFKRVVAILKEAGYRGDLCIENESLGKFKGRVREVLAREVALLKELA